MMVTTFFKEVSTNDNALKLEMNMKSSLWEQVMVTLQTAKVMQSNIKWNICNRNGEFSGWHKIYS